MTKQKQGAISFSWRGILLSILSFLIFITLFTLLIEAIGIQRLQESLDEAGPLAPLLYILLKAATYVFAPLTSGPIQLSAGLLFGLWEGVIYTIIGETLGGSINFWISRLLGRRVVKRFVGEEGMKQVEGLYDRVGGWAALAYARVFLFALYDFMSYTVGLMHLRFSTYVIVSFVFGLIPTFVFVAVGTTLAQDRSALLLVYGFVGVVSVVPLLLNKRLRQMLFQRKSEKTPSETLLEGAGDGD